jgi:hypothetical protein
MILIFVADFAVDVPSNPRESFLSLFELISFVSTNYSSSGISILSRRRLTSVMKTTRSGDKLAGGRLAPQ